MARYLSACFSRDRHFSSTFGGSEGSLHHLGFLPHLIDHPILPSLERQPTDVSTNCHNNVLQVFRVFHKPTVKDDDDDHDHDGSHPSEHNRTAGCRDKLQICNPRPQHHREEICCKWDTPAARCDRSSTGSSLLRCRGTQIHRPPLQLFRHQSRPLSSKAGPDHVRARGPMFSVFSGFSQ